MQEEFSDTTLMAYADGELDAETRIEIERALARDAALAARLDMFTKTRRAASDAFEAHLDGPVPDALASSIAAMVERHEGATGSATSATGEPADNVFAFDRKPRFSMLRFDVALAASIALVAGGVVGYLASGVGGVSPSSSILTADLTNPLLPIALRSVASGDEMDLDGGSRFRAIASFRDEADNICREFAIDYTDTSTVVSVACQADEQWHVQFTVAASSTDDGYAPASSLEALDAYLMAIGAGAPLSEDEEQTVLDGLR
ncbi:anti-sigma factor [Oceaniradius stylonematis]|uniref:anti-sigma factor n=1 Tax=Oceaniradius stylonematis TaxID=2184161 RepID=UPI00273E95A6|nr:anti-sigma factor [Oceaniradius stylonematis]